MLLSEVMLAEVSFISFSNLRVSTIPLALSTNTYPQQVITSLVKFSSLLISLLAGTLKVGIDISWLEDWWARSSLVVTKLDLISNLSGVLGGWCRVVLVCWVVGGSGWGLGGWVLCDLLGDLAWLGVGHIDCVASS